FYEEALQRLIDRGVAFAAVPVPCASWVEIDDPADLETAGRRVSVARSSPGRPLEAEELVDLHLPRPIAPALLPGLLASRITPNQVTLLSGVIGVAAGLLLLAARTAPAALLVAALLLFLSVVLDCADGQLARARGIHSNAGATLDGIADYAVAF